MDFQRSGRIKILREKVMKKKILSIVTSIVMALSFVGIMPELSDYKVEAATLTEEQFASKISSLKNTYVHGQYWNKYNGYDKTGTIKCSCTYSCPASCNCKCGRFELNGTYYGAQCFGFANKLGYLIFGSVPTASWGKHYNKNNLYAGDYVRIDNDRHSIFITKVQDGVVEYADCNRTGACQVRWGGTMSIASMNVTYIMHLSGNNLKGTTNNPINTPVDTSYNTPFYNVTPKSTTGLTTVYNVYGTPYSTNVRNIAPGDICTIHEVYTTGFCKVTYPTSNGTHTEYARTADMNITNISIDSRFQPYMNLTSYLCNNSTAYVSTGEIWATDKCTITAVYTNGTCDVTYPTSNGTKNVNTSLSYFVPNTSGNFEKFSAPGKIYAYSRPDFAVNIGYTDPGDSCVKVAVSGDKTQIIYPITGGFKLGWVNTSEISPHVHSYGEWYTSKNPSCTENGEKQRKCSCGATETQTISKIDHTYVNTVKAPTCTEKGYTNHSCKNCGSSYNDSEKAALGHSWGSWTTSKAATCTADGSKTRKCSRCSKTETATIAKTGHNYVNTVKNPTCTEKGYTNHKCQNCGNSYNDTEKAALGHNWGTWTVIKDATCIEEGSKTRKCSVCGNTETETIKVTDHKYGEWDVKRTENCISSGEKTRKCSVCGDSETVITPKKGHTYTEQIIEPTCSEKGYTLHICSSCGDKYKDTYVECCDHSYELKNIDGVTSVVCTMCKTQQITFKGEGTSESPYLISGKEDLLCLSDLMLNETTALLFRNKCYKQTNDIDLKNISWTPLGLFKEGFVYDGGNHNIFNLNVDSNAYYVGLFGKIDYGTVKNLSVYGNVNATNDYGTGGIVGELAYGATISDCCFTGSVTGANNVGGIAGKSWEGGNILNCYSSGNVTSTNRASGIIGLIQDKDYESEIHNTVQNCYFVGEIDGKIIGGIAGEHNETGTLNINNTSKIINCYYLKKAAENGIGEGTLTKNDSTPLISPIMKQIATDLGKSYSENSYNKINNGYPVFNWQMPSKVKGDINNDGDTCISDIVVMQQYLTNKSAISESQFISADMNDDGAVNVFDIVIAKRMILEK